MKQATRRPEMLEQFLTRALYQINAQASNVRDSFRIRKLSEAELTMMVFINDTLVPTDDNTDTFDHHLSFPRLRASLL